MLPSSQSEFPQHIPAGWSCSPEFHVFPPDLSELLGYSSKVDVLHGVATALGRPERYLRRIAEVVREVVDGNALSDRAKAAMLRDLEMGSQGLENRV